MLFSAIAVPCLLGLVICMLLASRSGNAGILFWMAPGVGIGLSSVLFFIWSLVFYPGFMQWVYSGLELALLAGLSFLLWKRRATIPPFRLRLPALRWGEALLGIAVAAAAFYFTYIFIIQVASNSLGGWDAWALWNNRARYLLLGNSETWRNVFSVHVNHSDYPYLLSGFIARCWVIIGKDRALVPVITAGLFTISTIGLFISATTRLRSFAAGLLGAFLLLSLPDFAWTSSSLYADLPLSYYFLMSLTLLMLWLREQDNFPLLAAAGTAASFALWTKNEGASFWLALLVVIAAAQLFERSTPGAALQRLLAFAGGSMPVLILFLYFKTCLTPPTDLFEQRSSAELLGLLGDPTRYRILALDLWERLGSYGSWRNLPFLPCLAGFAALVGFRTIPRTERPGILALAAALALTFCQYMVIYLITPHDLSWHLSTSVGRLYNQLLPSGLLLLLLLLNHPLQGRQKKQPPAPSA